MLTPLSRVGICLSCIVFLASALCANSACAECSVEGVVYCRHDLRYVLDENLGFPPDQVWCWHPGANKPNRLWHTKNWVLRVYPSNGGPIAVLTKELPAESLAYLQLLSRAGNCMRTVFADREIEECCWNPEGTQIAFSIGVQDEKSHWAYTSNGVFVLDISSGDRRLIRDEGYELHWAAFDKALYIRTTRASYAPVSRYDFEEETWAETEYETTDFSTEGTYYLIEEIPFRIMLRDKNRPVAAPEKRSAGWFYSFRLSPQRWLNDRQLLCIQSAATKNDPGHIVLDVETWEARNPSRKVLKAYDESTAVLMGADRVPFLEKYADMPLISPDDLAKDPGEDSAYPLGPP